MKELVVISGKGGTGKTLVASSFLSLSEEAVGADCDVDTPNLHLFFSSYITEEENYYGPEIAVLNKNRCTGCGLCMKENLCRFHAIKKGDLPKFNYFYCRGCGVCSYICQADAISLEKRICGKVYTGKTEINPIIYGHLSPGHLGSGKMVVQIKNKARNKAIKTGKKFLIVDSSAGIGCKVIASISGADLALVVTEPTISAISDLMRVIELAGHFSIPLAVCINKYGINRVNEKKIIDYCNEQSIKVLTSLPMDEKLILLEKEDLPIRRNPEGKLSKSIVKLWNEIKKML